MPFSQKSLKLISDTFPEERFSDEKLSVFSKLFDLIVETNEKLNVTSITDEIPFLTKHIIDSLFVFRAGKEIPDIVEKKNICDIGCGGGFPGLPVAIAREDMKITMIDSTEKKITALNENISRLGLKNVSGVSGRGEELAAKGKPMRESFDIALSRAVARLSVLSELCIPFVRPGGYFIALKGMKAEEELSECKETFSKLGSKLISCTRIDNALPDISAFSDEERKSITEYFDSERYLVIVKKIKPTDEKYPRRWDKIKKMPL